MKKKTKAKNTKKTKSVKSGKGAKPLKVITLSNGWEMSVYKSKNDFALLNATINVDDSVYLKGINLIPYEDGNFISTPAFKTKKGYKNHFFFSSELRDEITETLDNIADEYLDDEDEEDDE